MDETVIKNSLTKSGMSISELLQGSPPTVEVTVVGNSELHDYASRVMRWEGPAFIYNDGVTGFFRVAASEKPIQHKGIVVALVGRYLAGDRVLDRFFLQEEAISGPGTLLPGQDIEDVFQFENVQFPMSSYDGEAVSTEYSVEIRVVRALKDFVSKTPIKVLDFQTRDRDRCCFHLGIRGLLDVEFIFLKRYFDVQDAILGKICFLEAKLRIVHMSLVLCRRERYIDRGVEIDKEVELKEFDVLDGAVVRGDSVPVRFFLGEIEICPFTAPEHCPLEVAYYLLARLHDETGKNYSKPLRIRIIRDGTGFSAGKY